MATQQHSIHTNPRSVAIHVSLAVICFWLGLLLLLFWNVAGRALWWDEGWTLSVARNWVERHHYGRLLFDQPAPPGLEAAFWVTWPVSLSFQVFGIGVWQGRLFSTLSTWVAIAALFALTARIYNRRVAWCTLGVALLLPLHPELNAFFVGRQVLAEMPMFAYLLLGYLLLLPGLHRSPLWLIPAALLMALSIAAKITIGPFWLAAMLAPMVVTAFQRNWRLFGRWSAVCGGTGIWYFILGALQDVIIGGQTLPRIAIPGIYSVTAVVTDAGVRQSALLALLVLGLPQIAGALWTMYTWNRGTWKRDMGSVRVSILMLFIGWAMWYALLSVGIPRYLFQAVFIGSIFTAVFLHDITSGFQPKLFINRLKEHLHNKKLLKVVSTFSILCVFAAVASQSIASSIRGMRQNDTSVFAATEYLNALPGSPTIETYESEVMFLLQKPYHYPPDEVHVQTNRRTLLKVHDAPVDYNPIANNPDYLVIGGFGGLSLLYQPIVNAGNFTLQAQFGDYRIYQRVRR